VSKRDEDAKYHLEVGAEDFVALSDMVAAHQEELPPPPPLPSGFIPKIALGSQGPPSEIPPRPLWVQPAWPHEGP
jgi:hypothetical protein